LAGIALLLAGATRPTPVVVLDPGHGGEQAGAQSASGLEEKTVALGIAKAARAYLAREGVKVRLTRLRDAHLPLSARPAVAERLKADAFVSIHLNHAPEPARRGWETYVRSADVSDASTARLLAQEEGEEAVAPSPEAEGSTLDAILGDLARGVAHERSARLAKAIQDAAAGFSALGPSRGLRQAPFTVLTRASVPAVLVEAGYLSNAEQAAFFATPRGQRLAGRAIARGVLAFLR
jgi:N-acetylmuramoyl-L-alanine amidase